MTIWEMSAGKLIALGGPLMYPIILCSVIALGIIIEKFIFFSGINTNTVKLKNNVFELIKKNQIKSAISLCSEDPSPIAKILKAGILKFGDTRESIKEAMEDVSLFEIPKLEKRFTALATIAHISPLLGLLGTVTGLSTCFHMIEVRATTLNPVSPGDLAGGIWEALLTTVAGLIVAIPTFVAYNYLVSRVNTIVIEMERAGTELVNLMCHISETQPSPEADG
jgi:biopolymer transport protein ExbB